jgi:rSAM/selenodomain-associated transferase 1
MKRPENKALIIFQKNLIKGTVKTRLAETMGEEAALEIYRKLVKHTHVQSSKVKADKLLFLSDQVSARDKVGYADYHYYVQAEGDLGFRMKNAFDHSFAKGYKKTIIIGTDCAAMTGSIIEDAFTLLDANDVVVGPAIDGGYYLIGMKKAVDGLFEGIPWSTDQVFALTMEKLKNNQLEYGCLPELPDVDSAADWESQKHLIDE